MIMNNIYNVCQLKTVQTPYYLYDMFLLKSTLESAYNAARAHNFKIHYAVKANTESKILQEVNKHRFGVDCVSANEIKKAINHGFKAKDIVFAGVGKTDSEIAFALSQQIFCINCESIEELEVIATIAEKMRLKAPVALRVNPNIDAQTHQKISTGLEDNKFGMPLFELQQALDICCQNSYLQFKGLHFHIGSQIKSETPFINLCKKASEIWHKFGIESYGGSVLNLGGGLAVDYSDPFNKPVPEFEHFFGLISKHLHIPTNVKVFFELGRSLVAQSGTLVTKVLYVKKGLTKNFAIVDAGMTELLRPALYQAFHKIEKFNNNGGAVKNYDIVGPVCESSDVFAKNVALPEIRRGDILMVRSCGAYAQSMSLRYNLRSLAPAYYLHNNPVDALQDHVATSFNTCPDYTFNFFSLQ